MNDLHAAVLLESARLLLEPLTIQHAEEMIEVLAEPALYEYTGGEAPSAQELTERYARQTAGRSVDDEQVWLNWIIRRRDSGEAIGFTQATLTRTDEAVVADIAWVVAPQHQGNGFASEAASTMCRWLGRQGTEQFVAFINPANRPSVGVARNLNMHVTDVMIDGEDRWES